jgi:3-isopropylmalate/(R)-2-methylmalate dehydratase small subunit
MEPFTTVSGPAAPLLLANVDTDVIIRIEPLTQQPREALGRFAFEVLRYRPDGSEDPEFVLNQPAFRGAPILLAGTNFGCGSSREGAVWALPGIGIRCVIAPSFGDIFFSNYFQNGVLPIVLDEHMIEELATSARTGAVMRVDLVHRQLSIATPMRLHFRSMTCGANRCSRAWTRSASRCGTRPSSRSGKTPIGRVVRGSGIPCARQASRTPTDLSIAPDRQGCRHRTQMIERRPCGGAR